MQIVITIFREVACERDQRGRAIAGNDLKLLDCQLSLLKSINIFSFVPHDSIFWITH